MFIAGIMDRPWLFEDSWQSPHTNQSSFISLDWSDFWQLINLCRRQFKIILGVRYNICRYHTLKTSFSDFFFSPNQSESKINFNLGVNLKRSQPSFEGLTMLHWIKWKKKKWAHIKSGTKRNQNPLIYFQWMMIIISFLSHLKLPICLDFLLDFRFRLF